MAIGDEKVRVVGYVDRNLIEALDKAAAAMGISRSAAIEGCIESGLDDLKMLSFVGLTPTRIKAVGKALRKLGFFKKGLVEFDFAAAMEKRELT